MFEGHAIFSPSSILIIPLTHVHSPYCLMSSAVARKLQTISWREQASAIEERTSGCSPTQHNPVRCMDSCFKCTLSLSASLHLTFFTAVLWFLSACIKMLSFFPNQTWMNVDDNYDWFECAPVNFKINHCSLFMLQFFLKMFSLGLLKLTWKGKSFYFINVRIQQKHGLYGIYSHQQSRLKPVCVCTSKTPRNIYSRRAHSSGL